MSVTGGIELGDVSGGWGFAGVEVGSILTNIGFRCRRTGHHPPLIFAPGTKFFYPFTTTLIELRLNREPLPLTGKNEVAWF